MELQQIESSPIAALPPAQRAMLALNSTTTEEKLREMVSESADITEVKDKAGREQAHSAAMKLKNTRIAIEKTGKAARDDANAFSKAVIDEEKRLKAIMAEEEARLFALRDAYDNEQARLKAEAERIERERISSIKTKISGIRQIPADLAGQPAAVLADELKVLQEYQPDAEQFAEFLDEAKATLATVIESISAMHQRQAAFEDEQARLAAERERLEQERKAREEEEARLRAEREALEAERRKLEEERAALAAQKLPVVEVAEEPVTVAVIDASRNFEQIAIPCTTVAASAHDATISVVVIEQPADGLHQIAEPEPVALTDTAEGLLREFVAIVRNNGLEYEEAFALLFKLSERARAILN